MDIRNSILIVTLAFIAEIGCEQSSASNVGESKNLEIDLAQPQPEVPVCSRCNLAKSGGNVYGDDELEFEINSLYKGNVTNVTLYTWDSAGIMTNHYFGTDVIDDINDPGIQTTIALVDAPTAVTALLTWVHAGGTQINTITVQ